VLLGEPQRTQIDLKFSFFGIPVRVHPFFWVIAVLLGPIKTELAEILVRVAAFFLAILVHELGHAVVMRAYGFRPWITLYGLGGLTSYNPAGDYGSKGSGPLRQILISAAGPGAGFVLAAVVVGLVAVFSKSLIGLEFGGSYGIAITSIPVNSLLLRLFVFYLVICSVFWGILNLLPVYPLDGGQIAREIFLTANPRNGIRQSLILSIITAAGLAVYALANRDFFLAFLFGYLAYASYSTLQAYTSRRGW